MKSAEKTEEKTEEKTAPSGPTPSGPTPLSFVNVVRDEVPPFYRRSPWTMEEKFVPALVVRNTGTTVVLRPIGEHQIYPALELAFDSPALVRS